MALISFRQFVLLAESLRPNEPALVAQPDPWPFAEGAAVAIAVTVVTVGRHLPR